MTPDNRRVQAWVPEDMRLVFFPREQMYMVWYKDRPKPVFDYGTFFHSWDAAAAAARRESYAQK